VADTGIATDIIKSAPIPHFKPAAPIPRHDAFDDLDYLFELKQDGFRALAYVDHNRARLMSRRANTYKSFFRLCEGIARELKCGEAVLDGEIVCLDSDGRPQFYELLRHRGKPVFYAFDLIWLDGKDLRELSLITRKHLLRSVVPQDSACLLYSDHIDQHGMALFRQACNRDLEGIVAKYRFGKYGESWFKIRNPTYSQREGRHELFDRKRSRVAGVGG
jgi:bifunctional non-homologous end joining protein LigD